MAKCEDCKYFQPISVFDKNGTHACKLTHIIVKPNTEKDCDYFNADLSKDNICYNCKYYLGGNDFGLFCTHEGHYHYVRKFNSEPCEDYIVTKHSAKD